MLYNAKLAQDMGRDLFAEGIYVIGFFFPVVAKGQARIRTQLSAGHERHHLEAGLAAFSKVGEKYGILGLDKKEINAEVRTVDRGEPAQGARHEPDPHHRDPACPRAGPSARTT